MKTSSRVIVIASLLFLAGCWNPFQNPFSGWFGGGDDDNTSRPSAQPSRVVEPTAKFAIAIGGVAPGRDELIIYDQYGNVRDFTGATLACKADDPIVAMRPRPDYDTEADGSGVQIIAVDPGVTAVRCTADGVDLGSVYEVTVPPQSIIQILVAEAGAQLANEAKLDDSQEGDVVAQGSTSPTGDALGAVILNRIEYINANDDPGLFGADEKDYDENTPASYYDAIILANGQFAPTSASDPTNEVFDDAQDRNFLASSWLVAYDQAVLTAAGIFNGDITDPTDGAFAFRSPTAEEWDLIGRALSDGEKEIPQGSGFTDASFPELAPIQILIMPGVWEYSGGRPSFVFARQRGENGDAIVNNP